MAMFALVFDTFFCICVSYIILSFSKPNRKSFADAQQIIKLENCESNCAFGFTKKRQREDVRHPCVVDTQTQLEKLQNYVVFQRFQGVFYQKKAKISEVRET